MVVPEAMESRPVYDHLPERRFKPNPDMGRYVPDGHFILPSVVERNYEAGAYVSVNLGPRYPPLPPMPPMLPAYPARPAYRGVMGPPPPPPCMGPPRRPPPPFLRHAPYCEHHMPLFLRAPPPPCPHMRSPPPPPPPVAARRYKGRRRAAKGKAKKGKRPEPKPVRKPEDGFLEDMSQPWITEDIRAQYVRKQELSQMARASRRDEDWAIFKQQREYCYSMIRAARDMYLSCQPASSMMFPSTDN